MAEFKFSCPQCNQHIQCDTGYAGMQINCPSCQKAIVVPQAPQLTATARPAYEAPPPPPPPGSAPSLATRQSTAAPAAGKRFAGAPNLTGAPLPKSNSKALKTTLIITAVAVVLAALGAGVWFFGIPKFKAHQAAQAAKKANPAAQVAAPTADAAVKALGILAKVHSAYTNTTSMKADGTVTMFLNLSNLTMADVQPGQAANANARTANRRPPGMPRTFSLSADMTIKTAHTNWFYLAGDTVVKEDRQTMSNTIAIWSSDKGMFMFNDSHQRGGASYQQLPTAAQANNAADQVRNFQNLFQDPAQLTKIVKDLGQTADEPVNGQDCYTLTAKVLGQKVKLWVDKTSYQIPQWEITLGGAISDADIDDAFSLVAAGMTNIPPGQLEMVKPMVKQYTPAVSKIRGTIGSTTKNLEINPPLTADDFDYPVPQGVRLIPLPGAAPAPAATPAAAREANQRNACINNLRQIDGAINEWALEKGKAKGAVVTEADIKPYLKLDAGGNLPKCPAGGKYTLGKVGDLPTCSIAGHTL
jgi:outer membrane lipoprotein-sorting protein